MRLGDPAIFAIESRMDGAYEQFAFMGVGAFYLHVGGRRFGVAGQFATFLSTAFGDAIRRCARRGEHRSRFELRQPAGLLATMWERARYDDDRDGIVLDGIEGDEIPRQVGFRCVMAPDGTRAFDDGTRVLQFDVGSKVRLIAWIGWASHIEDLQEVYLPADEFYGTLEQWHSMFLKEWEAAEKQAE